MATYMRTTGFKNGGMDTKLYTSQQSVYIH